MKSKIYYILFLVFFSLTISSCYHRPCDAYSYEKNIEDEVTFDTF